MAQNIQTAFSGVQISKAGKPHIFTNDVMQIVFRTKLIIRSIVSDEYMRAVCFRTPVLEIIDQGGGNIII